MEYAYYNDFDLVYARTDLIGSNSEGIMKKQLSENEFRSRCDKVIENSGTTEQLRERLAHLLLGMTKKMWYNET